MKSLLVLILFFSASVQARVSCAPQDILNRLKIEKSLAVKKAGTVDDFKKRIDYYHQIYLESDRNFIFPLIALHGAKWAHEYFLENDLGMIMIKLSGLGILIRPELKKIDKLKNGLKSINRDVFIDIVSKYHTAMAHLECDQKLSILQFKPTLIMALKKSRSPYELSPSQKYAIYKEMLLYEQDQNVAPKIKLLAASLNLKSWEKDLFLTPTVQFDYFPNNIKFKFKNFFDTQERIDNALKAAVIGLQVGEPTVEQFIN